MRLDIITIFPEYFAALDVSLLGKARQRGLVDVRLHDLREWAHDRHRTVDDTPYGGGPGMVMKPEPWGEALDAIGPASRLIVPTPSGRPFGQRLAAAYAAEPWLVFACGRYEGIDARVIDEARERMPVDEVSVGDYVLAGGESAVLVIVEAVTRLLPGVLGNAGSAGDDSFAPGPMESLLEGPVYTKPPTWRGRDVPKVLLSGDHGAIARWRRDQALRRTAATRPELVARNVLDDADRRTVAEAGLETVTYLEMTGPQDLNPARPVPGVTLERAATGSPLIRELSERVGGPYQWRNATWPDERWTEYLADPRVRVWFVTCDGAPAGIAAYELQPGGEVEITHFGLVPEFVGRGIGAYALTLAIRTAWGLVPDARRVWLHTSTHDHPNALPNYRKRGLRVYRTDVRDG